MTKAKTVPSAAERNKVISQMLRIKGSIKVSELQEFLGVSDMTVRRCLNEMANDGLLRRVHGGAVALNAADRYFSFPARLAENRDAKMRLSEEAVDLVPMDGSIYLDGGTTCFMVAKQLGVSGKRCLVVTDSMAVAVELNDKPGLDTLLMGGQLSGDNNTLDGPLTAEIAAKFSVDLAITSASSFSTEQVEVRAMAGVLAKKVIIQRAAKVMCVADSTKYDKQSCFRFCGWDEIDLFVTDSRLPDNAAKEIAGKGVELHVVHIE